MSWFKSKQPCRPPFWTMSTPHECNSEGSLPLSEVVWKRLSCLSWRHRRQGWQLPDRWMFKKKKRWWHRGLQHFFSFKSTSQCFDSDGLIFSISLCLGQGILNIEGGGSFAVPVLDYWLWQCLRDSLVRGAVRKQLSQPQSVICSLCSPWKAHAGAGVYIAAVQVPMLGQDMPWRKCSLWAGPILEQVCPDGLQLMESPHWTLGKVCRERSERTNLSIPKIPLC